jgi:archaellum component FlaC
MDNEQLIDKVQTMLLGMEERIDRRFDGVEHRFDGVDRRLEGVDRRLEGVEGRLGTVETKLDSVAREVTLHNQLLAPFIRWSHQIEDEVIRLSAQLQDVQARLKKLETPQTQ